MSQAVQIVANESVSNKLGPEFLSVAATESVRHLHRSLEAYKETPLVSLPTLAKKLGVKGIYVKDESYRFGLKAFKGLGGIYALSKVVCKKLSLDINKIAFTDLQKPENKKQIQTMVFVTATDGNHGKGVAWAARQLGCEAHVYMPKGSSEKRAQAIRDAGQAEVVITKMGYDDTVRYAESMSKEHGWTLIQDTSWPGYEEVPSWIIQGYTTMAYEAAEQLKKAGVIRPTHVFLQAGVGAMSGGITGFLVNYYNDARPIITTVEPDQVACIYESARQKDGKPHKATGNEITIMAGLNCAEPCTLTWPILRDFASFYLACPDYVAAKGMRQLAAPLGIDQKVVSGESGAATMGALLMLCENEDLKKERKLIGLDKDAVILLFSTEGDTDPNSYEKIVYDGAYGCPEK